MTGPQKIEALCHALDAVAEVSEALRHHLQHADPHGSAEEPQASIPPNARLV